ncbi:hypothetical protein ON010_g17783 [Phytophthora cinnamomi]|nr:hypothetical protein ON010_g17783 [Phytophthora cinnamomi]
MARFEQQIGGRFPPHASTHARILQAHPPSDPYTTNIGSNNLLLEHAKLAQHSPRSRSAYLAPRDVSSSLRIRRPSPLLLGALIWSPHSENREQIDPDPAIGEKWQSGLGDPIVWLEKKRFESEGTPPRSRAAGRSPLSNCQGRTTNSSASAPSSERPQQQLDGCA